MVTGGLISTAIASLGPALTGLGSSTIPTLRSSRPVATGLCAAVAARLCAAIATRLPTSVRGAPTSLSGSARASTRSTTVLSRASGSPVLRASARSAIVLSRAAGTAARGPGMLRRSCVLCRSRMLRRGGVRRRSGVRSPAA